MYSFILSLKLFYWQDARNCFLTVQLFPWGCISPICLLTGTSITSGSSRTFFSLPGYCWGLSKTRWSLSTSLAVPGSCMHFLPFNPFQPALLYQPHTLYNLPPIHDLLNLHTAVTCLPSSCTSSAQWERHGFLVSLDMMVWVKFILWSLFWKRKKPGVIFQATQTLFLCTLFQITSDSSLKCH